MSLTPSSRKICEPTPISTRRRSGSPCLRFLRSAFCAIELDTPFGRKSRMRTMTPRPSRAISCIAFSISAPVDGVHAHQHRAGGAKIPLDQGQMLDGLHRGLIDVKIEAAAKQAVDR